MRAKSIESLKRMALSQGAILETEGRRLNSARSVVKAATKPKPAEPVVEEPMAYMPEATPAPVPATVESDPSGIADAVLAIDRYAAASFLVNDSNQRVLGAIQEMLAKVSAHQPVEAAQKRPTRWVFTVKRDMRGLMEKVEAMAVLD